MKYLYLLAVLPLVFILNMCRPFGGYWSPVSDRFYVIENRTSYPLILSLEFHNIVTNEPLSVYVETDSRNPFAEVNYDQIAEVKDRSASLRSVMLFNLMDTTSLSWSTTPAHPFFQTLFMEGHTRPAWRMSSADSTLWFISRELWTAPVAADVRFILSATYELLEIMRKDYSMLERFAEFYERE